MKNKTKDIKVFSLIFLVVVCILGIIYYQFKTQNIGYYNTYSNEEIIKKYNKQIENIAELQIPGPHGVTDDITFYNDGIEACYNKFEEINEEYNYDLLTFSYHYYKPVEKLVGDIIDFNNIDEVDKKDDELKQDDKENNDEKNGEEEINIGSEENHLSDSDMNDGGLLSQMSNMTERTKLLLKRTMDEYPPLEEDTLYEQNLITK